MTIRPRTLRRLGAFLLIAAAIAALAMLFHERSVRREAASLLDQRRLGLEAVALGDYETALAGLGTYLSDFDPRQVEADFEARLGYAEARARIYEAGERHLEQAGRMLRDLADDFTEESRRLKALHLLMQVTAIGRDWQELRRQCDEALAQHPLDRLSLRMRREALEQLGENEAALADSQMLVGLAPNDVDEQIRLLRLLAKLGNPPERIVTHAVNLAASNASDPRFLLVLAVAYRNAGQSQQALTCLRQAADFQLPADDAAGFVTRMAGLFDALGEHGEAREVYKLSVQRLPPQDPSRDHLRHLLALRLWQIGELEGALDVVSADASENSPDVGLAATRTLLLFEKGDNAQALQSLASLQRLSDISAVPEVRRRALAWHEGISAAYAAEDLSTRKRLEALLVSQGRILELRADDDVLVKDQPTGLLMKWTADQYARLSELQIAMLYWRRASAMLPGWGEPWLRVAEAASHLGLVREAQAAVEAAEHAFEGEAREPLQALKARIAHQQWLQQPSTVGRMRVSVLAAAHQRTDPLDPDTLAAHVQLTAQTDPSEARRIIRQRLELGADALLRAELIEVSRLAGLGMEEELLRNIDELAAVLLRARSCSTAPAQRQALAELEAVLGEGETASVDLELERARLLSRLGAPEASATWRQVAALYPQNLAVQLAVFEERAMLEGDSRLAMETIERLSQLTGPTAGRWRFERARWLLGQGSRDAALDAAQLLRALIRQSGGGAESIEPRMLLADALLQVGSQEVAREHLEAAFALDPSRGDVGLRLLELYEASGRWDEARDVLLRLAAAGVGPIRYRVDVAARLAALGYEQVAVSLLKQARDTGQLDERSQVMLADWLHRVGRLREAEAAFDALVENDASGEALLGAAAFFAHTGRRDRADALLTRLERLQPSDVERQQARALCLRRMGDHQRARDALGLVLARVPKTPESWAEAAILELACGDAAAAMDILRRARSAGVDDQGLALLELQAEALAAAPADDPAAQLELLASGLGKLDEGYVWQPIAAALLEAAGALRDRRGLTSQELVRLERAASAVAHYRPLHAVLTGFYEERRMFAERMRAAGRIADALPHDPLAQRLAFEASRDAGQAAQARFYAARWQKAARTDPLLSAAAMAEAQLLAGNHASAHEAILPDAALAGDAGKESPRLLMLVAEIQAARGDYPAAWQRIAPHLAQSSAWRTTAIRCAAERMTDVHQASRWLEDIEQVLESASDERPSAASRESERLAIAEAWVRLGMRLENRTALERGRAQLAQLVAGPLAQNVEAWEALAEAALASGYADHAQTALRRVLALNLRRSAAANSLARLLIQSGDLAVQREAQTWAAMAIEHSPGVAQYHSTLGRARLAVESLPAAREAFERALQLDESNLDAMLGLARVLVVEGEGEVAAQLYALLLPIYRSAEPRQPELRADFEILDATFRAGP